jgi:hypothetical protein
MNSPTLMCIDDRPQMDRWTDGHVCSLWLTDCSLDRASSILIPRLASPPVIRDLKMSRVASFPVALTLGFTCPF